MSRRRDVPKRIAMPDPRYNNKLVGKFINVIMKKGKKGVAQSIVYGAFDVIQERLKDAPLSIFERAMDNVKPIIEVKSRRVGGATYQVPMEVRSDRRIALAMRWIIAYAGARPEKAMSLKLAGELIDAANNRGAAVKKREDTHKMADANKAFAHYRW